MGNPGAIVSNPDAVVAVLTCHNRVSTTLRCLEAVHVAARHSRLQLSAVLVDDGSTDGTADEVERRFPWVRVERADGTLFWNRGMHRAMAVAMRQPHAYLLWLNDDTEVLPDALDRLLGAARARPDEQCIVVGASADPDSGRVTYSGMVAPSRWRPFSFKKVFSAEQALPCDTMNGNCVLIPAHVAARVGNLDPAFEHSMGDIDYGLRARRQGISVIVAPGIAGVCAANTALLAYADARLSWRQRWRTFTSRKVLPVGSWRHLTRTHGGVLWPLYFAWPYLAFVFGAAIRSTLKRNTTLP